LSWEVLGFRDGFEGYCRRRDFTIWIASALLKNIMALGGTLIAFTTTAKLRCPDWREGEIVLWWRPPSKSRKHGKEF